MQLVCIKEVVDVSRSASHSQSSPPRSRLLALPLVALCAMVYLGSAAHFALVQHSTCLEHGDVLHLEEGGAISQAHGPEASFSDERIARAGQKGWIGHGAEAHCSDVSLRREALLPAAGSLAARDAQATSGREPPPELWLAEPVARLRLAPKSSPPLS